MIPTSILHEAELELWESVAYDEEKASGLGSDFEREVERSIRIIRQTPEQWHLHEDGTRRYLMHRFPYLVVYICLNDHLWIIAFAHCKRRPGYWSGRT